MQIPLEGIAPDIEVAFTPEDKEDGKDIQLERAVALLLEKSQ